MSRTLTSALALGAGLAGACGSGSGPGRDDAQGFQRLSTLVCEQAAACGCDGFDRRDCGEVTLPGFDPSVADGRFDGVGPAFSEACLERWVGFIESLDCSGDLMSPGYADVCPLYHGSIFEGLECADTDDPFFSVCGPGLWCIDGRCLDPEGRAFGGRGQPCDFGQTCDDELDCRAGQCLPLPGAGMGCVGTDCDSASVCGTGEVCISRPVLGEPCAPGQCAAGLSCEPDALGDRVCTRRVANGEPCTGHRQCASEFCPAGRCTPPLRVGDSCSSTLPCGPGLTCNAAVCVRDGGTPDGSRSICALGL